MPMQEDFTVYQVKTVSFMEVFASFYPILFNEQN